MTTAPTNEEEQGDVIFVNQIQSENDNTWSTPLSFQASFQRVTNDGEGNFCGQDEHSAIGQERVYDDVDVADIDADGDLDLLFGNRDRTTGVGLTDVKYANLILVNEGGLQGGEIGHFVAQEVGIDDDVSHDARFFDYDQDGDQDILLLMECVGFCNGDDMGPGFSLLRNDVIEGDQAGDDFPIEFTDVTVQVTGVETTIDGIISGVITDLDGDSYPEAVLIHNFIPGETIILRNDAGDLSVEKIDIGERAYSITSADINRDGYPDIVTSTTLANRWPNIFLNDGTGSFEQPAITTGDSSPWFDPDAQAKVGGDPTVADYEVAPNFNQNLAADIGDLDGDGVLDYYFSQSESLNGLLGVNPKADEDRIYLGGNGCR